MSERVKQLPSRIVQITDADGVPGCAVWALCEDGSLWALRYDGDEDIEFANVHPPHEPPPVFDDLKEALRALKNLLWCANPHGFPEPSVTTEAKKLLVKHGAY